MTPIFFKKVNHWFWVYTSSLKVVCDLLKFSLSYSMTKAFRKKIVLIHHRLSYHQDGDFGKKMARYFLKEYLLNSLVCRYYYTTLAVCKNMGN